MTKETRRGKVHCWCICCSCFHSSHKTQRGKVASADNILGSKTSKEPAMGILQRSLPHFSCGTVVKGFGRGSRTLGTPTANFEESVIDHLPANLPTGIYYGWAQVDQGPVFESVTSIGWNPYFKNQKKSMETYIMHNFDQDFYGSNLKLLLVGYLRDEMNFDSLDDLKAAIQKDIDDARRELQKHENLAHAGSSYFVPVKEQTSVPSNQVSGTSETV